VYGKLADPDRRVHQRPYFLVIQHIPSKLSLSLSLFCSSEQLIKQSGAVITLLERTITDATSLIFQNCAYHFALIAARSARLYVAIARCFLISLPRLLHQRQLERFLRSFCVKQQSAHARRSLDRDGHLLSLSVSRSCVREDGDSHSSQLRKLWARSLHGRAEI